MRVSLFFVVSLTFDFFGKVTCDAAPIGSTPMKIMNYAGAPVELYWINVFDKDGDDAPLVLQTTKPLRNNTDTQINSYNTHQFVIKFEKPPGGDDLKAQFIKGPKEETITIYYTPEKGLFLTQLTKFDELLIKVKEKTSSCSLLEGDQFDLCFAKGIADDVIKTEEQKTEIVKYRNLMSSRLRNYTCEDETMKTSEPVRSTKVNIKGTVYDTDILYDTPEAKIWVMHDFISEEECKVLETNGRPKLERATVAGEDGLNTISESRKANQATYSSHRNNKDDPLYALNSRVLETTNSHTGFNLQFAGQEDFTTIQYNKDDQYTPHCDGGCEGDDHKIGGRVATSILYCQVATKGGGTTFTKTDIFIKPTKGMATFFSYKGPDGKMDEGFTEHSGCPVKEGEKWITTVWMREGVTANEPWTAFDPRGNRVEIEQNEVVEAVEAIAETEVLQDCNPSTENCGKVEAVVDEDKGSSWFQRNMNKMKAGIGKIWSAKPEL